VAVHWPTQVRAPFAGAYRSESQNSRRGELDLLQRALAEAEGIAEGAEQPPLGPPHRNLRLLDAASRWPIGQSWLSRITPNACTPQRE
jgi:hypothetical protein